MNKLKQFGFLIAGILFSNQASGQVEMADTFRSEGKIFVLVAIILIVLIGVFIYLFMLDRKVKKLEERFSDRHQTK